MSKPATNSVSYGCFAEVNAAPALARSQKVEVFGPDGAFTARVHRIEAPGAWAWPPLAAVVTSAARLLLALAECLVHDAGGIVAHEDTDSAAVVASERGGLIPCPGGAERLRGRPAVRALSWAEADAIAARFAPLNVIADLVPGSPLRLERENFDADGARRELVFYGLGAKAYALGVRTADGGVEVVKGSEHVFGQRADPEDVHAFREPGERQWVRDLWQPFIERGLGLPEHEPPWLGEAALEWSSASTPALARAWSVAPFGRVLRAHPLRLALAFRGMGGVAPLSMDGGRTWREAGSGQPIAVSADWQAGGRGCIVVEGYSHLRTDRMLAGVPAMAGPDGGVVQSETSGLLVPREVRASGVRLCGKEANDLDVRAAGLAERLDDHLVIYRPGCPRSGIVHVNGACMCRRRCRACGKVLRDGAGGREFCSPACRDGTRSPCVSCGAAPALPRRSRCEACQRVHHAAESRMYRACKGGRRKKAAGPAPRRVRTASPAGVKEGV